MEDKNIISIDEKAKEKALEQEQALVRQINNLHNEFAGYFVKGLEKGIRIGELLLRQKLKMKHGEWIPWVEKYLVFTERTAQRYIRLYENRDKLETDKVGDLTGAYRLLAAPDKPKQAKASLPFWENISTKLQAIAKSIDKKIKAEGGLNIDESVRTAINLRLAYIHELIRDKREDDNADQ